jgi:hypothetical protein
MDIVFVLALYGECMICTLGPIARLYPNGSAKRVGRATMGMALGRNTRDDPASAAGNGQRREVEPRLFTVVDPAGPPVLP